MAGRSGTDLEKVETKKYIDELEADIMPIDSLIGFAQSEQGKAYFGVQAAAKIAAHAQRSKRLEHVTVIVPPVRSLQRFLNKG
jgi:predicted DCC family thiol-disulfide oxidoreductase YuxK